MRARSLIGLTILNVILLSVSLLRQFHPALAAEQPSILRGRGLQIVDAQGRVRASISVIEPEKTGGGAAAETVLLRLITEKGRPSVKIDASETSSGMSVVGPTGTKSTYAILQAKEKTSSLTLRGEDGREQVVNP